MCVVLPGGKETIAVGTRWYSQLCPGQQLCFARGLSCYECTGRSECGVEQRMTRQAATDPEEKRAHKRAAQKQKELEAKAKMREQHQKESERCKREAKKKKDTMKG